MARENVFATVDEVEINSDDLQAMLDNIFGSADDGGDDQPDEPIKIPALISSYNGTSAPYINIGALNVPASDLTIDVLFSCDALNSGEIRGIYGCEQHDGRDRYELYVDNRSGTYRIIRSEFSGVNEQIKYLDTNYDKQKVELLTRKGFMYYKNNVVIYNIPDMVITYPFILFGCYNNSQTKVTHLNGTTKIYYFKIYNKDELIVDYIPCLDDNGIACMYDNVSKTYKYSDNSLQFQYIEEEVIE